MVVICLAARIGWISGTWTVANIFECSVTSASPAAHVSGSRFTPQNSVSPPRLVQRASGTWISNPPRSAFSATRLTVPQSMWCLSGILVAVKPPSRFAPNTPSFSLFPLSNASIAMSPSPLLLSSRIQKRVVDTLCVGELRPGFDQPGFPNGFEHRVQRLRADAQILR